MVVGVYDHAFLKRYVVKFVLVLPALINFRLQALFVFLPLGLLLSVECLELRLVVVDETLAAVLTEREHLNVVQVVASALVYAVNGSVWIFHTGWREQALRKGKLLVFLEGDREVLASPSCVTSEGVVMVLKRMLGLVPACCTRQAVVGQISV